MDQRIKNYLGMAVIAALAVAAAVSVWYVSIFSASTPSARSFSVSGEGKVVAVPDVAELSMSVLTEGGKDLADPQKQNTEKANRVIVFVKGHGVEAKDIQTSSYTITPRYKYFSCVSGVVLRPGDDVKPCPPPEIAGYSINQTIAVKVRDLDKTGDVLAGVVDAGANTVSGPSFTIDDPEALQNQAREKAMRAAKEKAKSIAKAGGFRLGRVVAVNEGGYIPQPMLFAERVDFGMGAAKAPAPVIEPGSQEVQVAVTITYAIR